MIRNKLSSLLCLALSISLCISMPASVFAAGSASAAGTDSDATWGVVCATHTSPETTSYSDSFFRGSSLEYNNSLATASMIVCMTTFHSRNASRQDYCFNLRQYLEDNGFTDFESNGEFDFDPDDGTVAPAACAHKMIKDNGRDYTLIVVVPRSGSCGSEYGDNCVMSENESDTGDYRGYANRAGRVAAFARDYIAEHDITGRIKLWTTGYSGGAGTVQVLAADILRNTAAALGTTVTLDPDDLYCYCFSGMNVAPLNGDHSSDIFKYIHNYCEDTDMTANMHTWNIFTRYGQVTTYSSKGNRDRMLELLEMESPGSYADYIASGDPMGFTPLKFDTDAIKKGKLGIIPDTNSYLPSVQTEYRDSLLESLTVLYKRSGSGDPRVGYYKDYQGPMTAFSRAIDNDTFLFNQFLTGTRTSVPLLVSMYMTYMTDMRITDRKARAADTIEDSFNALAGFIEDGSGSLKPAYSRLRFYTQIRDLLFSAAEQDGGIRYELKYDFTQSVNNKLILRTMKSLTGRLFVMSLEEAMQANGIDESRYEEVLSTENSNAIAWELAYFMFANPLQSGKWEPFSFENEQFKQAATLLGNLNNLLTPHNSSNLIEWLRSADAAYDDYALPNEAQSAGYRRIFIDSADGTTFSGKVTDSEGTVIAEIKKGRMAGSNDKWIGITTSDNGNWLRLPVDRDYRVEFSYDDDTTAKIKADDYSAGGNEVVRSVTSDSKYNWTGIKAKAVDLFTLSIPQAAKTGDGYDIAGADYSLTIQKGRIPYIEKIKSGIPKAANVKSKAGRKAFTVSWKKAGTAQKRKFDKTEVQYSTSKKFAASATITRQLSKNRTSLKVNNLKKGRKYYVRVRNVKYSGKYRYVSKWSAVRAVRAK